MRAHLAAFRWGLSTAAAVRGQLLRGRVDEVAVPAPPPSIRSCRRSAWAGLRLATRNCLVRSLVRQAWLAAAGDPRDVVVGVRRRPAFGAHAWLEGDPLPPEEGFEELVRLPSR